jgi:hypothetical protein
MRVRQFLSAVLLISLSSFQLAKAQTASPTYCYTLQVAAFPEAEKESADRLVADLSRAGEMIAWGTAELPGRGKWIRIFVGSFATSSEANRYGASLQARGIIKEFFVRASVEINSLTRPRSIIREKLNGLKYTSRPIIASGLRIASNEAPETEPNYPATIEAASSIESESLPVVDEVDLTIAPPTDMSLIPRVDPVEFAIKSIVGEAQTGNQGGLWVTGDKVEARARLKWILGIDTFELLNLDSDDRLQIDRTLLAEAAGASEVGPNSAPLVVLDYILSNEGLLLLVQLTHASHRYRLHIGGEAPTFGSPVLVAGGINLDNNFDSRINPYRRAGAKLDQERPPEGFDSLIAINPVARWYNLHASCMVPDGNITFHELAEAYAKLELKLDYLNQGSRLGAHNTAIERERRLKSQRPDSVVVTAGPNRVLRSEEEMRQFYAENNGASDHQR